MRRTPTDVLRRAVPVALAVALLVAVFSTVIEHAGPRAVRPSAEFNAGGYDWTGVHRNRPGPQRLSIGVTHAQYSIDDWGNQGARVSARNVLAAAATYQNQHIFGWGTLNPEPSPGVFDWSSLDRRMKLIRDTGGTPVLTLCCAPDWMKGGRAGQTDWSRLHAAPTPEHYADFAALAVAVARRYPDVRHFLVWNEMKGFWDNAQNRWSYEAYTELYNAVYAALEKAVPGVAVGGPYVVLDTWADRDAGGRPSTLSGECGTVDQRSIDVLDYWLKNKIGADFVAVDGGSITRDAAVVSSTTVASAVFGALTRWLRQRTSLPVWWAEFHVGQATDDGQRRLVASSVAALLHMVREGASVALVWQPELASDNPHEPSAPALWTSTHNKAGGRPLALAEAVARLQDLLAGPADGDLVWWPLADLGVLAGPEAMLMVNTADHAVATRVRGLSVRLAPYEVRYLPVPPGLPPVPPQWWTPAVDRCLREAPQATP